MTAPSSGVPDRLRPRIAAGVEAMRARGCNVVLGECRFGGALGPLGLPIVLDVECGHVQPSLPLVLGAHARVVVGGDRREITQTLA